MLSAITDYNIFKKDFHLKFAATLSENPKFRNFCYEVFTLGTAYIVGGYIRDISFNKSSRDLDLLIHLPHDKILAILQEINIDYKINRLKGIKIFDEKIEVDLWSIEHNWAFENKVVERNDDNILESIANGCFYNYDSLVLNLHTNNLNVRHYNEMVLKNTLDIIQKNNFYKKLNPTIEANILRAFYLRERYNLNFSSNCLEYLKSRIGHLEDEFKSSANRLDEYIIRYPKYQEILTKEKIISYINYCNTQQIQTKLF